MKQYRSKDRNVCLPTRLDFDSAVFSRFLWLSACFVSSRRTVSLSGAATSSLPASDYPLSTLYWGFGCTFVPSVVLYSYSSGAYRWLPVWCFRFLSFVSCSAVVCCCLLLLLFNFLFLVDRLSGAIINKILKRDHSSKVEKRTKQQQQLSKKTTKDNTERRDVDKQTRDHNDPHPLFCEQKFVVCFYLATYKTEKQLRCCFPFAASKSGLWDEHARSICTNFLYHNK